MKKLILLLIFSSALFASCKKGPSPNDGSPPQGCIDQDWMFHFLPDHFMDNPGDTFVMVYHDTVSGKYDTSIVYDIRYSNGINCPYRGSGDYTCILFFYKYESITSSSTWGGLVIPLLRIRATVGKDCIHAVRGDSKYGGGFGTSLYDPFAGEWEEGLDSLIVKNNIRVNDSIYNNVYYFPFAGAYDEIYFVKNLGLAKKTIYNEGTFDLIKTYKK